IWRKRDCANSSMSATAVAFTDLGEVDHIALYCPRIGAHSHFDSKAATAQSNAVHRVRMQIIWNELVISLKIVIGDIEIDGSVLAFGALFQDFHRLLVPFHQGRNERGNKRLLDHLSQRLAYQQRYELGWKVRIIVGLNHHGQLQCWLGHLYCHLGTAEL